MKRSLKGRLIYIVYKLKDELKISSRKIFSKKSLTTFVS